MKDPKLHKALSNLSLALAERDREGSSPINDAGVSKCFEVALEYFWKFLKRVIEDSGLEATSPKDTIKVGASIGMVKNPEKWIRYINWFLDCLGRAISNAESTLCAVLFKAQL